MNYLNPDLTQQPPRSPRIRLGGFAHLPRLIDKARASLADSLGEYVYGEDSLLDTEFFKFTGISPEDFREAVAITDGDLAVLDWLQASTSTPLPDYQVEAWSHWIETTPGLSIGARAWFAEYSNSLTPARPDIRTLFEYLDVDDYIRFGGHA